MHSREANHEGLTKGAVPYACLPCGGVFIRAMCSHVFFTNLPCCRDHACNTIHFEWHCTNLATGSLTGANACQLKKGESTFTHKKTVYNAGSYESGRLQHERGCGPFRPRLLGKTRHSSATNAGFIILSTKFE